MSPFRPSISRPRRRQIAWLLPGMQVKRWLLLFMLGLVIISLGVGYFLRELYLTYTFPQSVYYLT